MSASSSAFFPSLLDDRAFDAALDEAHAALDVVERGVLARLAHRGGVLLDADDARAARREEDRERARAAVQVDDVAVLREPRREEAEDAPDHLAVHLEERRGRHAVAHALDRLFHLALAPHVDHLAAEHRVRRARLERVGDADDAAHAPRERGRALFDRGRLAVGRDRQHRLARRRARAHDRVLRAGERVARVGRARRVVQPADRGVELRQHDGARVDAHQRVRARLIEPERRLARRRAVDDQRHLVAVVARVRHPDRPPHVGVREAADAAQRAAHDLLFPRELRGVREVLHLTAAAHAEHRAERLRAHRRLRLVRDDVGDRVLRLHLRDAHARALAGQRAGDEHDLAVDAADRLTVGEQVGETNRRDDAGHQAGRRAPAGGRGHLRLFLLVERLDEVVRFVDERLDAVGRLVRRRFTPQRDAQRDEPPRPRRWRSRGRYPPT